MKRRSPRNPEKGVESLEQDGEFVFPILLNPEKGVERAQGRGGARSRLLRIPKRELKGREAAEAREALRAFESRKGS